MARPKANLAPIAVRVLRALLGGPMSPGQFEARFGHFPASLTSLAKSGLVEKTGGGTSATLYRITDAGRAALPPRNPALATRHINLPVMGENVRGPSHQRTGNRCQTSTHS